MSGKVVHFEIPFDDGDRARKFYGETFGWQLTSMPDMGYTMVTTGPTDPETGASEAGFINGGMFSRSEDYPGKGPNIVIDVPSIDEALRNIEAAGGKPASERTPVGEMGFAAYFLDPEGNVIGLWESA
ncbi:MAG: VOC family protein [Nocardioides sp.]|nr:VOC family protein [Nocardioides sp.]